MLGRGEISYSLVVSIDTRVGMTSLLIGKVKFLSLHYESSDSTLAGRGALLFQLGERV